MGLNLGGARVLVTGASRALGPAIYPVTVVGGLTTEAPCHVALAVRCRNAVCERSTLEAFDLPL